MNCGTGSEPTAEADRGRHPGFPSFNVLAGGPGSLAERSREESSVLSYEDARRIARHHADALPPLPVRFRRRHTEGRRVQAGWYFDYGVEKVLPNQGGPGSGIGGAPGFLVGDDAQITVVGWPQLRAVLQGRRGAPGPQE